MDDEFGRSPSRGDVAPGTTRRTWVRTAVNAAWTAPLVSIATTAPAHASASLNDALQIDTAVFYYASPDGTSTTVYPLITVTNPTTRSTGVVVVTLRFPVGDFVGADSSQTPPTPRFVNDQPIPTVDGDWTVATVLPKKTSTVVSVHLTKSLGLAAHTSSTVGGAVGTSAPFGIVFANQPTVDQVAVVVEATETGFAVTSWSLTEVDPPS
jgi:hypothetical protein